MYCRRLVLTNMLWCIVISVDLFLVYLLKQIKLLSVVFMKKKINFVPVLLCCWFIVIYV